MTPRPAMARAPKARNPTAAQVARVRARQQAWARQVRSNLVKMSVLTSGTPCHEVDRFLILKVLHAAERDLDGLLAEVWAIGGTWGWMTGSMMRHRLKLLKDAGFVKQAGKQYSITSKGESVVMALTAMKKVMEGDC